MNPPSAASIADELLGQQRWVRELAQGLLADPHAAEDAAQGAWLDALRHGSAPAGEARSWWSRVLRNRIRQDHRAEQRRQAREHRAGAAAPATEPSALHHVQRLEHQRQLVDEMLALADADRTILVQRYFEGLSVAEIAAQASVPARTAESRLRRALERLRGRLQQRWGAEQDAWRGSLVALATIPGLRATGLSGGAKALAAGALLLLLGSGVAYLATRPADSEPLGSARGTAAEAPPPAAADSSEPTPAATASLAAVAASRRAPTAPPAASALTRDGVQVRGRVVDADGQPLPEASVLWLCFDPSRREGRDLAPTLSSCDEQGLFVLEGLTRGLKLYVQGGAVGYRPSEGNDLVQLEDDLELPDLALAAADGRVHGRVVDLQGQPLAGVEVLASHKLGNTELEPEEFHRQIIQAGFLCRALSDAQGRFSLDGVRLRDGDRTTKLLLRCEGHASQLAPEVVIDGEALLLRMGPHPVVELRVEGLASGETVEVFVDRFRPDLDIDRVDLASPISEARLQIEEGAAEVSVELRRAPSVVRVRVETAQGVRVQEARLLQPGERWQPVLRLPGAEAAVWTAQVVEHGSGTPIAGATVQRVDPRRFPDPLQRPPRNRESLIRADGDGRFEFAPDPARPMGLIVRCPGYANQVVAPEHLQGPAATLLIPLIAGARLKVEVDFPSELWSRQQVYVTAEHWTLPPIQRERHGIRESLPAPEKQVGTYLSMSGPSFSLQHLPPGLYRVELPELVDDPDRWFGDVLRRARLVDGELSTLRFEQGDASRLGHLELRVRVDGAPAAEALARLQQEPRGAFPKFRSDVNGVWRIDHVAPDQDLTFSTTREVGVPGFFLDGPQAGETLSLEVSICHVDLQLEVQDASTGEPLAGAQIHLQGHATPHWTRDGRLHLDHWRSATHLREAAITDEQGQVTMRRPSGRWSYRVEHPGHVPAIVEWRIGAQPNPDDRVLLLQPAQRRLELDTPVWMHGEARPPLFAWVWQRDGAQETSEPDLRVSAHWDGDTLVFDTLPAGPLELLVMAEPRWRGASLAATRIQVDLPDEGSARGTLTMALGCTAVVQLEDAAGRPLTGFQLEAFDERGQALAQIAYGDRPMRSADAVFRIQGREEHFFAALPAGPVEFRVLQGGIEHSRHTVSLPVQNPAQPNHRVILVLD